MFRKLSVRCSSPVGQKNLLSPNPLKSPAEGDGHYSQCNVLPVLKYGKENQSNDTA